MAETVLLQRGSQAHIVVFITAGIGTTGRIERRRRRGTRNSIESNIIIITISSSISSIIGRSSSRSDFGVSRRKRGESLGHAEAGRDRHTVAATVCPSVRITTSSIIIGSMLQVVGGTRNVHGRTVLKLPVRRTTIITITVTTTANNTTIDISTISMFSVVGCVCDGELGGHS